MKQFDGDGDRGGTMNRLVTMNRTLPQMEYAVSHEWIDINGDLHETIGSPTKACCTLMAAVKYVENYFGYNSMTRVVVKDGNFRVVRYKFNHVVQAISAINGR